MKEKIRVLALTLAMVCLLGVLSPLGAAEGVRPMPAARLSIFLDVLTNNVLVNTYGPAVPMTDSPLESRMWLTLPREAFSGLMTLHIEDTLGEYTQFQPANNMPLTDVMDAGSGLRNTFQTIIVMDGSGEAVGYCQLYISSWELPGSDTPSVPTEAPVEVPTEIPFEQPTEVPYEEPTKAPIQPANVTVRYLNVAG